MSNVIEFPSFPEFEELSLFERMMIIEAWQEEVADNLTRIRESAAAIEKLVEASKKHLS
ncbi:hypothetical protein SJ05684_c21820 [Sinorhizobium sojae CCBAU 05684]|uniref:Uncharacterized protein n=1 Tax=Sinorhizobium sojae CCBAU 05684 TaxID=716928 RepID=A0A249PCG7_9HYPH|nr:hypothetical protein [Sinorhizobium sojae]ASY63623.1 hypothetical protein SJ05684_c21820 [Sinorhizobium sojae CCBAU 05684]